MLPLLVHDLEIVWFFACLVILHENTTTESMYGELVLVLHLHIYALVLE